MTMATASQVMVTPTTRMTRATMTIKATMMATTIMGSVSLL